MKYTLFTMNFILAFFGYSQSETANFQTEDISISRWIDGTLLTPTQSNSSTLAIIIAGSGPTNRDGNQNFLQNNSLKKLAVALTKAGISTFRYDKRIVKQIREGNVDKNTMFDDFVDDAKLVLDYFKTKNTYDNIHIIGHSQGSLIGMLAAKNAATGFISLAGAGQNIGDVLVAQVTKMAPALGEETAIIVAYLKEGTTVTDYPPALGSLFNADLQPFMTNWMTHDPAAILKTLDMPILLINGDKDLQVSVEEAQLLKASNEDAQLEIIENMNHVLFEIEGGELENSKSYNETFRPVSEKLISRILMFMKF